MLEAFYSRSNQAPHIRKSLYQNPTKMPSVKTTNVHNDKSTTKPSQYDFVMLCDSNRKFLNINKLFSNRNRKIIACNTTRKAKEILESPKFEVKKGIINTGVNDLEHLFAEEIVKSQVQIVNMAVKEFLGRQIDVCGIIPRGDELDKQIPDINRFTSRLKTSLV